MEILAAAGDITKIETGAILVTHFEDEKIPGTAAAAADKKLNGAITGLIKQKDIKGKLNELTVIHSLGKLPAAKVVVLGMGKKKDLTDNKVRGAFAEACRFLRTKNVTSFASVTLGAGTLPDNDAVTVMSEGAILGLYTFKQYMTKKENGDNEIKTITIFAEDKSTAVTAIKKGKIAAEAVNWARDLVNEPSNHLNPEDMAEAAREMAKTFGLKVEVFEKEKIKELGMGGLLGVNQGSYAPPKFIKVSYNGTKSKDIDIALIGKGITFDSGGISLKPSENMGDMKGDMAGGASVLAAIRAIAQYKPKINVMAIVPATENLPSGTAMKPGDVIKIMNGKTVEVNNTDAEGRLILADALSYAVKLKAKNLIDIATLTGACQVALGNITTGEFSNNKALEEKIITAGKEAGEPVWAMPMDDEYFEGMKSDIADMKNSGGRYGGAITGAKFLEQYVDKTPWVHLDIAGTSDTDKDKGYNVKGATGVPVRTLINFVMNEANK